jgi:hypothetical protein
MPFPVRSEQQKGSAGAGKWPLPRRWTAFVLLLVMVFLGLRLVHTLQPEPRPVSVATRSMVVVGVTARYQFSAADRAVLDAHTQEVQVGAVSVRPRYIGDCAAAGWTTLGAGRRTAVGGLCYPHVREQRVIDWPQRLAAAAAHHGDAQLGTLAGSVPGCVAAVGPGAALAAARPDGTLSHYTTARQFLTSGLPTPCPVTLIDGGQDSDQVVATLAKRPGTTVVVTGVGPAPGSHSQDLQVIYAVPTNQAGWLTSASTRRDGVVNLTDLTRFLIDFGTDNVHQSLPVDGAPFQTTADAVTADTAAEHLDAVAALSHAVLRGDLALAAGGALLLAMAALGIRAHRYAMVRVVAAAATVLPAAMMLTGAAPWPHTSLPAVILTLTVTDWWAALTFTVLAAAKRLKVPLAAAGAAMTVAAFTVDAALGAVMEPGSMLNSRPVNGGRWYGFGNVTFAVYAAATLVLAGYLAHRLQAAGRRRAGLVAAAAVGLGVVVCEGWPSMGADFGGVIALAPAVLWLVLALSDVSLTWPKMFAATALGALLVAAISWLDWRRGPGMRTHLGNFVQRVLDGDAQDIIIRKAAAAGQSLLTPAGLAALILGVGVWALIFRRLIPRISDNFAAVRAVAVAELGVAILGTVLNDGGVTVWYTVTAAFTVTVAALSIDQAYQNRLQGPASQPGAAPIHSSKSAGVVHLW